MLRNLVTRRFASNMGTQGSTQGSIPRRPLKKIRLGKARPAIYYKFDTQVELSDGSVITRRSQFPKDEIRLIQDQRNNPLWNMSRDDLVVVDANSGGSMDKFKQKYSSIFLLEDESKMAVEEDDKKPDEQTAKTEAVGEKKQVEEDAFGVEDYLSMLNDEASQIKTGKLATKKKAKK